MTALRTTGASVTLGRSALAPEIQTRQQPGHDLLWRRRESEASLAWVRIDDGFPEHPKQRAAGPLGRELFVAALCHSNRYLTDGRMKMDDLHRLAQYHGVFVDDPLSVVHPRPVVEEIAERLVSAGLFEQLEGEYQFQIHDYKDYQPSKAAVLAERARAKGYRARKKAERAGLSVSEKVIVQKTSGRGTKENHLEQEVPARELMVCPGCGPMPYKSERRLRDHIELVHPELAGEAA